MPTPEERAAFRGRWADKSDAEIRTAMVEAVRPGWKAVELEEILKERAEAAGAAREGRREWRDWLRDGLMVLLGVILAKVAEWLF